MFLLLPRFLFIVLMVLVNYLLLKLALIGRKKNTPLAGCRKVTINIVNYVCWRLIGVVTFFTWHTYRYLREDEISYEEYLGEREIKPVHESLGSIMKDFYARPEEHSSRFIRQQSGKDFVSRASEMVKPEDIERGLHLRKRAL